MHNLFRKEVVEENRGRLTGELCLNQPVSFFKFAVLILCFIVVSIVYLVTNDFERKVRVPGVIVPDKGIVKVKANKQGVISDILVSEQDYVDASQPVFKLNTERVSNEGVVVNKSILLNYMTQISNLQSIITENNEQLALELSRIEKSKGSIQRELSLLKNREAIMDSRESINEKIVSKLSTLQSSGHSSTLELDKQKDSLLRLQQDSIALKERYLILQNQLDDVDIMKYRLNSDNRTLNAKLERDISELESKVSQLQFDTSSEIRAPTSGTVTTVLKKIGQEVKANDSLFSILPTDSRLEAILYVPTSAFAFVEKGQDIRLRYHAFSYHHFGVFNGTIKEVSTNVLYPEETVIPQSITTPSYRVVVSIEHEYVEAYGKKADLRPGMTLDGDIILGKRSLFEWLFEPIYIMAKELES